MISKIDLHLPVLLSKIVSCYSDSLCIFSYYSLELLNTQSRTNVGLDTVGLTDAKTMTLTTRQSL